MLDEEKINKFLDKLLEFKSLFVNKANKINALVEEIEEIKSNKQIFKFIEPELYIHQDDYLLDELENMREEGIEF